MSPLAQAPGVTSGKWNQNGSTFSDATAGPRDAGQPITADFWPRFGSPTLTGLIAEGLRANASLEAARARVGKARAAVRLARAALLPTVGVTTGLQQNKTNNSGAAEFAYSAGSASLDIGYDVDLFGAARAGKRAAAARSLAAGYDVIAAGLVIETEIARDYVTLAALGDRLALVDRNLANARELLRIVGIRQREGVATQVDYGLQTVELHKLAAQRLQLDQSRRAMVTAIAVLIGREAPDFDLTAEPLSALIAPTIDPGQPGDLVFRRPDVRAAEARIAAANGDVQQARAAFRPALHLSASGLVQALSASGPFGLTLTAGQSLFTPIFQGGRLRGQLEQASASQLESVALYRQALLTSLQEGTNALAGVGLVDARQGVLAAAVDEARRTIALSQRQYRDGAVDLSTVLDAERNEIALEDQLLQARQDRLTAAIDVYKALGGTPLAQRGGT